MFVLLGWVLLAGLPTPTTRVTLWTDRTDPYRRGSAAHIYLSVDQPSYVSVLRVDTDGRVRVVFPRDPWGDNHVLAGRPVDVGEASGGGTWMVEDDPGVGYLFAVASAEPLDFRRVTRGDYWDFRSLEGGRIRGDPYVPLTELASQLAPDDRYDYDVVPYYVGQHYDYPRFVCYDCHAYASYAEWDPYRTPCERFRVEVRDDPRYYPYRYGGGRNITTARVLHPGPRYVFRDAAPGADYVTRTPLRHSPDQGATSGDIGGRGSVPAPGRSAPRLPGRRELAPEIGDRPTAGERRPIGEPELRRRRP